MSRAFVNEDNAAAQADQPVERQVSAQPNYVTPARPGPVAGKVAELQTLHAEQSAKGEQADKQRLADLERDLRYFKQRLGSAQVVPAATSTEKVQIGSWVTFADEHATERRVQLVGEDQADAAPRPDQLGLTAGSGAARRTTQRRSAVAAPGRRSTDRSDPHRTGLNHALGQHGIGDFDEAGDVRALDVVDPAVLFAVMHASVVDRLHDRVQLAVHFATGPRRRMAFCDISSPLTATPPALDALPGANRMPASMNRSTASRVVGMFAPSATQMQPLRSKVRAASASSSFCVAHGSAISQAQAPRTADRRGTPGQNGRPVR